MTLLSRSQIKVVALYQHTTFDVNKSIRFKSQPFLYPQWFGWSVKLRNACWLLTISHQIFQEYSVQLTFREQWLDERLKFNDFGGRLKYLTLTEANRVWMPDLFFSNEKEGHFHNIIMPNVYIRIFPYGSVLYSIRSVTDEQLFQSIAGVIGIAINAILRDTSVIWE